MPLLTGTVRIGATGPIPPAEVWRRYEEYAAWPAWSPYLRKVEVDGVRLAPGAEGKVLGPPGISVRFTILDVDEAARAWSWRVRRGPVSLRLHHGVEAGPGGGTRTTLALDGPWPVILAYAPIARLALQRLVSRV